MVWFESIIVLLAFFVFGLIGQVLALTVIEGDMIHKEIAGYFGFALGFMVFGFLYFKNLIDHLQQEKEQLEQQLKVKRIVADELREKVQAYEDRQAMIRGKSSRDGKAMVEEENA